MMPPDKTTGGDIRYRSAMDTAAGLLARRRHTRRELERKLGQRGIDADTIASVVAACERLGYVNDDDTARAYIGELSGKGYGRRHIRQAMHQKGFAPEVIETGLTRRYPPADEVDAAVRAAEKKYRQLGRRDSGRTLRDKVYRFLYTRGFTAEAVGAAMAEVFKSGG